MARPLAGPQTLLRTLNSRAILEALARRGPLTRAELMNETGLSRTAVTQVLRMLESGGSVTAAGVDRETQGPAATRVSLHPALGHAVAVHIDHRAAHVVAVDAHGSVRAEAHSPFDFYDSLADRVDRIDALVERCRTAAPGALHLAVVGVPGIVSADGDIRDDAGPDGGMFRSALAERLRCPVRVENDVNLAALAELSAGAAERLDSFALLHFDDGLGAGFVINGALHRGSSGAAGEVTYLPQPPLPIGAPVVNEAVVADLALGVGRDPDAGVAAHLDAATEGDPAAQQIVDEVARRLTLVAGSVALVLDPEAFILSGTAAHPALVAAVEAFAQRYAEQLPMRFHTASFGTEAPMVGAIGEAASALRATLFTQMPDRRSAR